MFFGWRGAKGRPDPHRGGGGGARGRHHNDFFISFIVHNQKSNGGGGQWGLHGMNGGHDPQAPHSYATVYHLKAIML